MAQREDLLRLRRRIGGPEEERESRVVGPCVGALYASRKREVDWAAALERRRGLETLADVALERPGHELDRHQAGDPIVSRSCSDPIFTPCLTTLYNPGRPMTSKRLRGIDGRLTFSSR